MINNWRWFISKTLRETIEDRHQITKMLAAQRDLIKTKKIAKLEQALDDLDALCRGPIDKEALQTGREKGRKLLLISKCLRMTWQCHFFGLYF